MKSITCFTESLGGGGAEHQIIVLARMLSEKGYEVSLVTYASLQDYYETPKGVKRIDIGFTRIKVRYLKAFIKAIKVFVFFLRIKTDCIIAYRECANLRVLPPLFFRTKRIRVICSDRNTSTKLTLRHSFLLHFLYRRADYIVPNSVTQALFIVEQNPLLKPKLHTIHNYTDPGIFVDSKMPEDTSIIKIAIFSRYSPQKNPLGFAEAVNTLKKRSNHPFEIHWYGEQNDNTGSYNSDYLNLFHKINELGISDVFILHPAVKNPVQFMNQYHAICLPSLYEGFSNSIAEGICCGKPMLVSDVSDNSIMVHQCVNGFLFNPKESESICNAFLDFFSLSYEDMITMAQSSRSIALQLFNKDSFLNQYVSLIES